MYLEFYGLDKNPFQISSDPLFLWLGEQHKEALATLKYGVLDNKGFLLLTGDVGTGKTTLINALINSLEDDVVVATVPDPGLADLDFYHFVADAFGIDMQFTTKGSFLIRFRQFLYEVKETDKKVLLIIDEAQRLDKDMLEEIRLLSNIETQAGKLFNIFFIGQIEFNDVLLIPQNRALRQRITIHYNIEPLTIEEVQNYIDYRLSVAGRTAPLFDDGAINSIYLFSKGYPRLINIVCDRALLTGFVQEQRTITQKIIAECSTELTILPSPQKNRETPAPPLENHQQIDNVITHIIERKPAFGLTRFVYLLALLLMLILIGFIVISPEQFNRFLATGGQYIVQVSERRKTANHELEKPPVNLQRFPVQISNTPGAQERSDAKQLSADSQFQTSAARRVISNETTGNHEKGESHAKSELTKTRRLHIADTVSSDSTLKDPSPKTGIRDTIKPEGKLVIYFPSNSIDISPYDYQRLDKLADLSRQYRKIIFILKGYSDNRGDPAYNKRLSEYRTKTIKYYLLGLGIRPDRIETLGLGSELTANGKLPGQTKLSKRRVEIEFKILE